jgi:predicted amidohydrolase YtcJ
MSASSTGRPARPPATVLAGVANSTEDVSNGAARGVTLITAGTIITMDPRRPRAEAVALKGETIAAVGSEDEVRKAAGDLASRIDLGDRALLPGFIDAHHHYCLAALDRRTPDLHLPPGSSMRDLLAGVGRAVAEQPTGWVRIQGYDPLRLREGRPPRAEELDEVCQSRPLLVIAYSFHEGCLNSRGLREMGWSNGSADPPNGRLVRRRGRLTGEVVEGAFFLSEARSRGSLLETGADAWGAECEAHGRELLQAGIVRVGDAAVPPAFERLYERAAADDRMPVTVHRMPVSSQSLIEPRLEGEPTGSGQLRAPIGPAKLFMDGAERCASCFTVRQALHAVGAQLGKAAGGEGLAALRAMVRTGHVRRGPDGLLHRGMLFWDQQTLNATVRRGAERGFQIAQHALGNEAVDVALRAVDHSRRSLEQCVGAPRLEHTMLLDSGQPQRIADLGVIAVPQPYWVYDMGDQLRLVSLPPPIRALGLRDLFDAGVEVAGSSDYPVAGYDVLGAVRAAVTRRGRSGELFEPEQAIEAEKAFRAYTVGAAKALGVESQAGAIEPGKRADLVALSADPLATDPDRLDELSVDRTWVGGCLAFARNETLPPPPS